MASPRELPALDPALALFCKTVPKAELHVHIEGTLEPALLLELAARNGVAIPFATVAEATQARSFTCLMDFLKLYYTGCDVLRQQRDYHDLTAAYLSRAAQDGLAHAEIFFDPQSHLLRGVTWGAMLDGMTAAMREAEERHGITSALVACFLRHLGPDAAMATLDGLLAANSRGAVIGVGLDSNEIHEDPSPWKSTFEKAAAAGLHLCAHAGEEESSQYVWDVIRMLQVQRVDHGVKSVDDDVLLLALAASRLPLTVCPLSNVRLQVFAGTYEAKLRRLLGSGCCITINSDDPAYFMTLEDSSQGSYLGYNYQYVARVGGLDAQAVADLARNSFRASWISGAEKERLIGAVDQALLAATLA